VVLPPARSPVGFAGGVGVLLLSCCAVPRWVLIPTVKHPTARYATVLFMVFPPQKLAPNIEANLPRKRNCNCRRSLKDAARGILFRPFRLCEKGRKRSGPSSSTPARALVRGYSRHLAAYFSLSPAYPSTGETG